MGAGRIAVFCAALGAGLCLSGAASAQDVQNFRPAAGTWNYLSAQSAQTAPRGALVPSLYLNYGRNPYTLRDTSGEVTDAIVSSMITADLLAVYGITDWLDLSVALPFSQVGGGVDLTGASRGAGFAVGDIRLMPKATVFDVGLIKLAVAIPVSLPSGDAASFTSDDTPTVHPKAIAELNLGHTRAAVNLGFKYRASNPGLGPLEVGNEVSYSAAATHELHPGLFALAEVFGVTPAESVRSDESSRPLEGLAGARYHTGWCGVFTGAAGLGIIGDYGTPQFRAIAGFAWQCPEAPAPALTDRDHDGLADPVDACPDDPEDIDHFEDTDGCPDPDNDRDGLLDVVDNCPLEAEDKDGFEDTDGCPDPDNDQDGILDGDDTCPLAPEDVDGFLDTDGCPDPDNDKDQILDVDDACPMEPETINGISDEDGCPDTVKVSLTSRKIEILDRIYFAFKRHEIEPRSFPVLDQVAAVLANNPKILGIRIEGHTDSRGTKRVNVPLSQRRAEAVRKYLIEKGINPVRLEAKGYASSRPLMAPGTKEAADKNRRVEFIILKKRSSP